MTSPHSQEIEHESFDFVLSSFPSSITQKVYGMYEQSAHQMNTLLSKIFLFLVRAACELRLSYGPKHAYAERPYMTCSFQVIHVSMHKMALSESDYDACLQL